MRPDARGTRGKFHRSDIIPVRVPIGDVPTARITPEGQLNPSPGAGTSLVRDQTTLVSAKAGGQGSLEPMSGMEEEVTGGSSSVNDRSKDNCGVSSRSVYVKPGRPSVHIEGVPTLP
jgi:hypothetical protein